MNTGLGIVLLVVFAIGAATILVWVAKQVASAYRRFVAHQPMTAVTKKQRFVRVGHGKVLTNLNDLPQYKGETGLFGLPRYRDVIVPNKHNYAAVVYMDHPVKQYFYDLMGSWKEATADSRFLLVWFCMIAGTSIINPVFGLLVAIFLLWFVFWMWPSTSRMERRSAENAKNFTPDDWRQIYREAAESKEREDELVRALRRSGVRRLYVDRCVK
ncbi:hypothetical protein [Devosia sp.]|uniref:hypothetical protein n=1 Tax=Devosia sp. TaxID=1871048 RepID=UPI0027356EAC|nr:hypothetical protein [Devosia sp.]MDP2779601.1 hypothetical protein [Devosia sp.]